MVTLSDETDANISARYAFLNANWEAFEQNVRDFYGFYGTNKANGDMGSIGFIGKKHSCWSQFTAINPTTLTWTSPTLGTVTRPTLPADYQAYLDAKGTTTSSAGAISATSSSAGSTSNDTNEDTAKIPSHEHDFSAEGGLVAVTVLVWLAVIALVAIFMY